MHKLFPFLFLILFAAAFSLSALPAQILIIRHAEKSSDGTALSTKGKERSAAFVPYFMETKALLTNGIPAAIYAMQSSYEDSSEHAIETVKALADKLKITINTKYVRDNYKKMVDEIKMDGNYSGKTVLICWEPSTIPEMARAFGALQTPAKWQPEIFDRIWVINLHPSGKPAFQNFPQRLLFGDTAN